MNRKAMLAILAVIVFGGAYLLMNRSESVNRTEDVYAYVPTTDDKAENMAELAEVPKSSATIGVGSQAIIPGWKLVDVVNKKLVTQRFSTGEMCGLEFGESITVVKMRGDNNLLVEYTASGNPTGMRCPSGIQFIVSKSDFAAINEQYATRGSIQAERELVKRLVAQNLYGKPMDAGNWRWVRVMNINSVVQNFGNEQEYFAYGDACGVGYFDFGIGFVDKRRTVRDRGESNGRVLYEYTTNGKPMGRECPSGILFFNKRR